MLEFKLGCYTRRRVLTLAPLRAAAAVLRRCRRSVTPPPPWTVAVSHYTLCDREEPESLSHSYTPSSARHLFDSLPQWANPPFLRIPSQIRSGM